MRKPAGILIIVGVVMLCLGWTIGTFFTQRTISKTILKIPGSPIILNSKYDKDKHSIFYSVYNPGGMPLKIVEESFVFTPGKKSSEERYVVSHLPVNVVLPPAVITKVELKLKKGTEKLHLGDAVLSTFSYSHSLSKDLYNVIHPFTMEVKKQKKSSKKGGK